MKCKITSMNGLGSACDGDGNQSVKIDVEKLVPARECCIYEVPKPLREINSKAYTPQLISIGPFHHDNKNLAADTQNQKERYRHEFVKKMGKERFDELKNFVKEKEKDIRNCYADRASRLFSETFVEVIVNDAIFIIELFWRNYHIHDYLRSDFLLHQRWLIKAIKLDLQLLENQLPYFVLKELYMIAFPEEISLSFLSLSCEFFDYDEKSAAVCNVVDFKYFLDLRRYAMMNSLHLQNYQEIQERPPKNRPAKKGPPKRRRKSKIYLVQSS